MKDPIEAVKHADIWAVSVQLLVLYCVSVAIFYALYAANRKIGDALKDAFKAGKPHAPAALFLAALALNFGGTAALVKIADKVTTEPRLAMVLVPLFLICEAYVVRLRAEPEMRRSYGAGMVGSALGMVAGMFVLMRSCPLK